MRTLMRLFGEDSALGRALNRLYILITANLLFVLFSLPVVTAGASWSALCYTLMRLRRGDRHFKVSSMFWRGFKESFRKATVFFLLVIVLVFVQVLEITWCRQFAGAAFLLQYPLVGLLVIEAILAMYLFPVTAAFNGGFGELLRDTLYFAFSRPLSMLLCLLLHALPVLVTYLCLNLLPLWALLWLIIGFSGIAYLSGAVMLRQFLPFLPEVDICGDIIPPELLGDPGVIASNGEDSDGDDPDEKTLQEMMKYGL